MQIADQKKELDPRIVQREGSETWLKTAELFIVYENGFYYPSLWAPDDGCGESRKGLNVATVDIAIRHALDWANAHDVRITNFEVKL